MRKREQREGQRLPGLEQLSRGRVRFRRPSPSSGVSTPPAAHPSTHAGAGRPRRQAVTGDLLKEQSRKDRGEGAGRQGATLLRRAGLGERACGTPRSVCARPRSPRYLLKKAAPVECSRIPNRGLRSWRLLNCFLLIPGA